MKGSSFPEFCNLSMLFEYNKLTSTFFYKSVLKGTGWPDSIFSFISTTVKRLSDLELKFNIICSNFGSTPVTESTKVIERALCSLVPGHI